MNDQCKPFPDEEATGWTTTSWVLPLLQAAADPLLLLDSEGRLCLWSYAAASLLGLKPEDLGVSFEQVIKHEPLRALIHRRVPEERQEIHFPNGRTFIATLTTLSEYGQLLVMQEVTQFKEMAHARTELIAAVAHDLRTPLTAVQGYIELLERAGPVNEEQREFIRRALLSLKAIDDLIEDLLDIGQLENGYTMVMHRLDIVELLLKSCCTFRPIVEEAGLALRCHLPNQSLWVMGNAARLRQAIGNLISNAIKYNRPNGWIALTAQQSDQHVIVSVADSGIGIPPGEHSRIFQRFYRIQDEHHANIPGSGLGLAIVKSIIEQHNGRIWVESTPGEGSTFSFVLPLLPKEEAV